MENIEASTSEGYVDTLRALEREALRALPPRVTEMFLTISAVAARVLEQRQ